MTTIFVDTNILLDVLADRKPFVTTSRIIWELSEANRIQACVSAISFNNIYYILKKAGGVKIAKKALENLRGIFTAILVDEKILNQAIDSEQDDFEDAIQYFCAMRIGARWLVTRNPNDFPHSEKLKIVTPEIFLSANSF